MAGSEVVLGDYSVVLHADMLLGSGAYGDVYRGEHAASGRPVAVKRINARKVSIEFMEQEVAAIRAASGHENVVSLLHHELQRSFMYLVVEMCKAGDMQEYFSQNEVRDVEAGRLLQDCVAAIHHLHTRTPAIAHRDIKPQNYLVTYIDGISRVKACDFGLSRMVPDETLFGLTTACGSPHYMAPELYRERVHYNTPVDIYALGMLLWAIDNRELRQPLKALTQGLQGLGLAWFMKGAGWNPFPQGASLDTPISALAKQMMRFDPDDRPNIVSVQRAVQDIVMDMDEHRREAEGLRREVRSLREEVQETDHLRLELQAKDTECQSKESENQQLLGELQMKEREISSQQNELHMKDREIESKVTENQRLRRHLKVKEREISSKQNDLHMKDETIESKEGENQRLRKDLKVKEREVSSKHNELHMKDREIESKEAENQRLRRELKVKERQVSSKENDLHMKDREIESKETENQQLRRELKIKEREVSSKQAEIERLRAKQLARGAAALNIRPSSSPASTVPRTPVIISAVPRIRLVKRQKLPFNTEYIVGVSVSGFWLEPGEFSKWDGKSVREICRVMRPGNVRAGSVKYQLSDGRWAVRQYSDTTTYLLSEDMASVTGTYTGNFGYLRGVVHDCLLYVKKGDSEKFNISILSPNHAHLSTLPATVGGNGVSVCCHPSGHFAVTHYGGSTLDMYASLTSPPRRVQLKYQPRAFNGVTAARDAIIMARCYPPELYVYDWCGRQLGQLTKGDLAVEEECIYAIGRVGVDRLMVAAGMDGYVTALYVYSLT